jgi:phenylacetate-CoA ligase
MGRERNMARLADGRRFYPLVGFYLYRGVADVRQYQIVQHGYERLEVRMVADPRPAPAQEEKLRAIIREALGHDFETVEFVYFEGRLPVGPNGKFEEFVCMFV